MHIWKPKSNIILHSTNGDIVSDLFLCVENNICTNLRNHKIIIEDFRS